MFTIFATLIYNFETLAFCLYIILVQKIKGSIKGKTHFIKND